jgi:uncharacterized membrane protein YhaH (DUF805 family)
MDLIANFKLVVMERYAQFDGRARRPEYWLFFLAVFIVGLVLNLLGRASGLFVVLGVVWSLAMLVPHLAVGVRRLHDTGRSGWWLLIGLVPCVGFIVLIVFLATESTPADNQYGPYVPAESA